VEEVRVNRLVPVLLRAVPWFVAGSILLCAVVGIPAFRRPSYWLALGEQYFPAAVLALALFPIILTGGIDLSVGSLSVWVSVVIGALWQSLGWPIELAVAAGIGAGLLAGLVNGKLIAFGVLPLVATLATRELFRGLAFTFSGDRPVDRFPPALGQFWRTPLLGAPVALVVFGILLAVTYVAVHHTWIGRMLFAIGDNEEAARFAGLPVRRVKLGLYAWSGLIAGLVGASLVMKYGAAKADAEKSLELTAIACVVLGGVRITGGAGHTLGVFLGIVTVVTLLAGLNRISATWRDTITGSLLIGVAVLNEAAARWSERRYACIDPTTKASEGEKS
jgi:ribose/xylose/arabinose/galactoside ABC-type transport system permease subunit